MIFKSLNQEAILKKKFYSGITTQTETFEEQVNFKNEFVNFNENTELKNLSKTEDTRKKN